MYLTLSKSKRQQPADAVLLKQRADQNERIQVTLVLRPRASAKKREQAIRKLSRQFPHQRKHLKMNEFVRDHGTREADLALVQRFALGNELELIESSAVKRSVIVAGPLSAVERAFRVKFQYYRRLGRSYRSFNDAVQIPAELNGIVEAVLGLEDRELMSHHTFITRNASAPHTQPSEAMLAYEFPTGADGKGQCVTIIELGGGFYEKDIQEYFKRHALTPPQLSVVEIDGQKNQPASAQVIKQILDLLGLEPQSGKVASKIAPADLAQGMWTIESTLDIELIGAFANAAEVVIYFAPNTAQGKYHALSTALNSKDHFPTVISCSWGAPEQSLPDDIVHCMEQLLQDAALKGITVCYSSGDKGDDCGSNGLPRAHYPASSPHVLGCGGTHWQNNSNPINEIVWNEKFPHGACESGGGVSSQFEHPAWQKAAGVKQKTKKNGRGVPDVSGKADINRGYCMYVAGYDVTMGGTSAAAPLWAGLIARINQILRKSIGFLTPLLYRSEFKKAFTDITEGNNGTHYQAGPGWDPCTGLGTPRGKQLLKTLRGL